jgi:DNA repair protein SbcD/Mre11
MRILHTSDWHIGRTFHGVDLLADQAATLGAIAELVATHHVDVVVVPGDVYDRSIPGADAIVVCNNGFEAIRAAGAVIVATSGNHDSPARLGAGARFAAAGGLHLFTTVADVDRPVLLSDEHGDVAIYGLPYLEPELTRAELGVPQARSHAEIVDAAMARVRADIDARGGVRSVVLAHAFVSGAASAGSERSISVGGVETVPATCFEGIDYVALGHLHSPQQVTEAIRYSGSPLPYSFGESSHRKAVWLIDFDESGLQEAQRWLTGTLDELLTRSDLLACEDHYVAAVLTDDVRPVEAMRRLQSRFPFAVHIEWQPRAGRPDLAYRERVEGRSDVEIARNFLCDVHAEPTRAELGWVEQALAAAVRERPDTTSDDDLVDEWAASA